LYKFQKKHQTLLELIVNYKKEMYYLFMIYCLD